MRESTSPNSDTAGQLKRVTLGSALGTTIEWYDFFVYGAMAALVFNKLFFPALSPAVGIIASFATFAAGFIARPLGGIVFGHLGDKIGRKKVLVATLILMGGSTFCMGLLPTHASIGLAAPILLTTFRVLQGFALGGEWASAASLTVEHAPAARRGYYGGWVQYGGVVGPLLSSSTVFVLSSTLSNAQFLSWGWRVPFLLSGALVVLALFVRLSIEETPIFKDLLAKDVTVRFPVVEVIRTQWRSVLAVGGMHLANTTIAYTMAVFILSYGTTNVGVSRSTFLGAVMLMYAIQALVALPLGALGDRIGRPAVYLAGTVGMVVIAFPMFWLVDTGEFPLIVLGLSLGTFVNALMYMTQGALFTELFSANVRCSGASLGVQGATVLAGGSAPLIAAALLTWNHGNPSGVAVYIMVIGLVSTAATVWALRILRGGISYSGSARVPPSATDSAARR